MAISAAINVILNLVLVPQFGMHGSAIAALVSLVFWNLYTLIFIKRKFDRFIGYLPIA